MQGALESFGRDLNRLFGIRASTGTVATASPQPGDVIYGNLANAKYWENQGNTNTCALMSTAMVIGQLTGEMPSQRDIVAEAETTRSSSSSRTGTYWVGSVQRTRNGMIYQSDQDEFVWGSDILQLLHNHKITASATYYTDNQSVRAFSDLEAALQRGDSVIISINSTVRNNAIYRRGALISGTITVNHFATVIAVNATQGKVYINDTALAQGQGNPLEMNKADFVAAWRPGRYTIIAAHLTQPGEQAGPAEFELVA